LIEVLGFSKQRTRLQTPTLPPTCLQSIAFRVVANTVAWDKKQSQEVTNNFVFEVPACAKLKKISDSPWRFISMSLAKPCLFSMRKILVYIGPIWSDVAV